MPTLTEVQRGLRLALQTAQKIEASPDETSCCDKATWTATCRVLGWVLSIEPAASEQSEIFSELRDCFQILEPKEPT